MNAGRTESPFEAAYVIHRDRFFRAIVVATGDPDLALDAVDRAFTMNKRGSRQVDPAAVFSSAAALVQRSPVHVSIRHPQLTDPEQAELLASFRKLDLPTRLDIAGSVLGELPAAIDEPGGTIDTGATEPLASWDGLIEIADQVGAPLSRLDAVNRGARRRMMVRWATALGGVAVVVAAAWGGIAALGGGQETPSTETTTTVASGGQGGLTMSWEQSGLPFDQGEISSVAATDDGFVAIGHDWNDPQGQSLRLLRSESGFDWSVEAFPVVGRDGGWVQELTSVDGTLYGLLSVSTPNGQDRPSLLISDGDEWQSLPIETDEQVIIGDYSIEVMTYFSSLFVTDDHITVVGSMSPTGDLFPIIREALPEDIDADGGWTIHAGGIEIHGMSGEVVFSASGDELDLPDGLFELASAGRPVMWRSEDGGETWEREEWRSPPGLFTSFYGDFVLDGDGRIFTIIHDQFAPGLWSAAPGEDLKRVELPSGVAPASVALHDGDIYVAGHSIDGGAAIWRQGDGESWDPVGGDATTGIVIESIRTAEDGLIARGQVGGAFPPAEVVIEVEDHALEMRADGHVLVLGSEGEVLAELYAEELERRPGGFVVVEQDSVELIRVSYQDLMQRWEQGRVGDGVDGPPEAVLLISPDGDRWLRADEGLAEGFSPSTVAWGNDALLASGYSDTGDGRPTVWVGSLAAPR